MPICSRCKRLNLQCRYQGVEVDWEPPARSDISQLTVTTLSHTVQSQVSAIIGDAEAIALSSTAFFSTIHPWFPIVNRDAYYRGLARFRSDASPEFSFLTLCLYLLGMRPTDGAMSGQMHGLYILATGLAASLAASGAGSVEFMCARLLLSIFEVGHGMYPAAYISMGANMRVAAAMGASLPSGKLLDRLGSCDAVSDARRVWQGLVILERYISLEMDKGLNANEILGENINGSLMQAQDAALNDLLRASGLLEETLTHIFTAAPYDAKYDEAIPLIQSLVALRDSLANDGRPILSCPATALCRSAFMIIMENGYRMEHPPGKDCSPLSIALLQADIDQFMGVCEDYMRTVPDYGGINIPIFFVHTIGIAALMTVRYFRDSQATNGMASVQCLQRVLEAVSKRWLAAGVYLEKIHREHHVPVSS
ncbi:hypothetical protein BDW68DRAFT_180123 [Aspergillus falconensis]